MLAFSTKIEAIDSDNVWILNSYRKRYMICEDICTACHSKQHAVLQMGHGKYGRVCASCGGAKIKRFTRQIGLTWNQSIYLMESHYGKKS